MLAKLKTEVVFEASWEPLWVEVRGTLAGYYDVWAMAHGSWLMPPSLRQLVGTRMSVPLIFPSTLS